MNVHACTTTPISPIKAKLVPASEEGGRDVELLEDDSDVEREEAGSGERGKFRMVE